jgi:tetratricopeptide (TPR) repeat protein
MSTSSSSAVFLSYAREDTAAAKRISDALGNLTAARERLPKAAELRTRLEREPKNPRVWSRLALVETFLGNGGEALKCAKRAVELYPESLDAYGGTRYGSTLALVYAWTGDKDRAIAEYARLLRTPAGRQNVHIMKGAPDYKPLRGDPRFEALLKDPKNNAPLF